MNEPRPDGESLPGPLLFGSRRGGFGRRRRGPRYCAWGRGTTTSTRGPRTFQVTVQVLGVSAHGVGASVQGRSLSVEDVLTGFRRRGVEAPGRFSFGAGRFSFRTGTGSFSAGPGSSGRGAGSGDGVAAGPGQRVATLTVCRSGAQSLPRIGRGVETRIGRSAAGARLRLPLAPTALAAVGNIGRAATTQGARRHGTTAGRAGGQDGECADQDEPRKRGRNRRLTHRKPPGLHANEREFTVRREDGKR